MATITDRIVFLVETHASGKAARFAKKAGIPQGTFHNYVSGRIPSVEHLINIRDSFGINLDWLLSGNGEPYVTKGKPQQPQGLDMAADEDPEIADLVAGARKVLTSGNQLAFDALARNIQYFSHAIETEKRLNEMESRVAALEEVIRKLTSPEDPEESDVRQAM